MSYQRNICFLILMQIFILSGVIFSENRTNLVKPSTKRNIIIAGMLELNHAVDTGAVQVEFSKKMNWKIIKTGNPLEVERGVSFNIQFYSSGIIIIYITDWMVSNSMCNFFGNIALTYDDKQDLINALLLSGEISNDDQQALKHFQNWNFYAIEEGIWTFGRSTSSKYSLLVSDKPDYVFLGCSSISFNCYGNHKINGIMFKKGKSYNYGSSLREGENFIEDGWDLFVVDSEAKIIKSSSPQPFIFSINAKNISEIWY